jgi:hypothetical protein
MDAPILEEGMAGADGRHVLAFEEPGKTVPSVENVRWLPVKPNQLAAPLAKQVAAREDRNIPLQPRGPRGLVGKQVPPAGLEPSWHVIDAEGRVPP